MRNISKDTVDCIISFTRNTTIINKFARFSRDYYSRICNRLPVGSLEDDRFVNLLVLIR